MIILQGSNASSGISMGRMLFFHKDEARVEKRSISDVPAEMSRFHNALSTAKAQLAALAQQTEQSLGASNSLLFEIHQMMLDDPDFVGSVTTMIEEQHLCAEYAVEETAQRLSGIFAALEDAYMRERAADILDVAHRVSRILLGSEDAVPFLTEPAILAAEDFSPSETAQFNIKTVLGLVTVKGACNSHTSLFARTMGIPAVVGLGEQLKPIYEGKPVILDGTGGRIIIEPDEETVAVYRCRAEESQRESCRLQALKNVPTQTKDGRRIKLFANITSPADMPGVLNNGAEGIGLFRSEFLFLGREDCPDEETQFEAYRMVAEKMKGKPLIIRTLDIGADKQAPYFAMPKEENPALGIRAIRLCLTRPELFAAQLRALYRASAFGDIHIMFPMIASLEELRQAKDAAAEARESLRKEGVAHNPNVPLGIMVETPAAAVLSDLFAREADFFSIGTNDLTQYTLAADRQNEQVAQFCNPHNEAVLRLIQFTAENAVKNGIPVGICGELAADETLSEWFIRIGITELSVVPSHILPLRDKILRLDLSVSSENR